MIPANRQRQSTTEEMRRGSGPIRGRIVRYSLDKGQVLRDLRDAMAEDPESETYVEGITAYDIATVEAGRPVRESLLKSMYGPDRLAEAFVGAEPDAVADAEDLAKSQREGAEVYETLLAIREQQVAREQRPLGSGPLVKSEIQCLLPSVADVRVRLRKALENREPFVHVNDMALLDTRRVREAVLKSLYPEAPLLELHDHEDLRDVLAGRSESVDLRKAARELDEAVERMNKAGRG